LGGKKAPKLSHQLWGPGGRAAWADWPRFLEPKHKKTKGWCVQKKKENQEMDPAVFEGERLKANAENIAEKGE